MCLGKYQDYVHKVHSINTKVHSWVTLTKLSYVEPSLYRDWCPHLVGILSQYLSRPLSLVIPLWVSATSLSHHWEEMASPA